MRRYTRRTTRLSSRRWDSSKSKKITNKKKFKYTGKVYDLTVENNHSYNINGIIVHNSGCLTSTNTGVHYPMASLISDISDIRPKNYTCKVIADGGIEGYSDVIKCLALGADYVMCGGIFTKATIDVMSIGTEVKYYGMSTKLAQKEMGSKNFKTSEGKFEILDKEYTLSGWAENMRDYLKSAMSYCNSKTLDEFKNNAECQVISPNSSKKVNDK